MSKSLALLAAGLLITTIGFAQTPTKKPTTTARKPATATHPGGPTHVTGAPVTTASGLQYWNIKPGTGALAIPGKKVKVQYAGWLTTGKKRSEEHTSELQSHSDLVCRL